MKKLVLSVLSGVLISIGARAQTDLFNTVQDWTGAGTNEAGMVIDWYNGTTSESLMWGYRWDGSATGEQMLEAIVAGDPRLFAEVNGFTTGFGDVVFGLGFAATGDEPIQLSTPLSFNNQNLASVASYGVVEDGRTAVNAGDLWLEGFNSGYWAYYNSTDARLSVNESDWDFASDGMGDRVLDNGDFDGWAFAPAFNGPAPSDFTAVSPAPEPTSLALLFFSGIFLFFIRKCRLSKNNLS